MAWLSSHALAAACLKRYGVLDRTDMRDVVSISKGLPTFLDNKWTPGRCWPCCWKDYCFLLGLSLVKGCLQGNDKQRCIGLCRYTDERTVFGANPVTSYAFKIQAEADQCTKAFALPYCRLATTSLEPIWVR